ARHLGRGGPQRAQGNAALRPCPGHHRPEVTGLPRGCAGHTSAMRDTFERADHRLFERLTTRAMPRLDNVIYSLSRAADHSKLWILCAAALSARPHRRPRRAALRGLVSVGIT